MTEQPTFEIRTGVQEHLVTAESLAREDALGVFERLGVIERKEGENGVNFIVDRNKLIETKLTSGFLSELGAVAIDQRWGDNDPLKALYYIFTTPTEDGKRVPIMMYEKGDENGQKKPVVYFPESKDVALDVDRIRNSEFLARFEEFDITGLQNLRSNQYPTLNEGVNSNLGRWEAETAVLLYNVAGGYRDETGKLKAHLPPEDGGRTVNVTSEFFKSWNFRGPRVRKVSLATGRPREFLEDYAPALLEHDLLRGSDFRGLSGSRTTERFGFAGKSPNQTGQISLESGYRYTIGREYGNGDHLVYKISEQYAAIVKMTEAGMKVVKLFDLQPIDEQKVKLDKTQSQRTGRYAHVNRVNMDNIRFIELDDITEKNSEIADYLNNFELILYLSNRLSRDYNINFFSLSLREQAMAESVYQEYGGNDEIWEFIKQNGVSGLKTLMLANEELTDPEAIFRVGQHPESPALFNNIASIVDTITNHEHAMTMREDLSEAELFRIYEINQVVMQQTSRLLAAASSVGDGNIKGVDIRDVNNALYRLSEEITNMYSQEFLLQLEGGSYRDLIKAYDENDGLGVREVILRQLERLWSERVYGLSSREGSKQAEEALNQMVLFYELHPEAFKHRGLVMRSGQKLLYRVLARGGFDKEEQKGVLGRVFSVVNVGNEIATMRQMIRDEKIPDSEREEIGKILGIVLGGVERISGGTDEFYTEFKYENTANAKEHQNKHPLYEELLRKHGINKTDRIRDIGSGPGDWVGYLIKQGYGDIRGLERFREYYEKSQEEFGEHFDNLDWSDMNYEGVRAFTALTNTLGHAVGEAQLRDTIKLIAEQLDDDGIFIGDWSNPEMEGGKINTEILKYREVLRSLNTPDQIADNSWYTVGTPNGKDYIDRFFPPEEWLRKLFEENGLEVEEVLKVPIPYLPNDESMIFVARKKKDSTQTT
jgi:hypothetical protein